jgi:hypothetical protein
MPAHSASEDARERAYGAGIHVLFCNTIKDVDGRDKPGMTQNELSQFNPALG